MLPINAEAEPIDVIGAGIVRSRAVPGFIRVGIIVGVKHPFNVGRAARADTIHDVTISLAKCFRAFPIFGLCIPLRAAVVSSRPREPGPIHFDSEHHNHWMIKVSSGVRPVVDVGVPLACKDLSQTELVRPVIFLVRLVPWRPKNKWQRTVPPNDIEIVHRKILFSPIARRRDDRLVFTHHLFKVLDHLETDVILFVTKIHERTRVSTALGNDRLHGAIWIDVRNRDVLSASDQRQAKSN